ncbi:MAG: lytic transglycosylase domain-containing protein [Alphaproteobacteria bacterium]|nr:lytic transglycosylase domain-containing protein [Alphaproteobacteria bacterium]
MKTLLHSPAWRPLIFASLAAAATYVSIDVAIALREPATAAQNEQEVTFLWGNRFSAPKITDPLAYNAEEPPMLAAPEPRSNDSAKDSASSPRMRWTAGISAWKRGEIGQAARHFSAAAKAENGAPDDNAAAAYWAYRAHDRLGYTARAQQYLSLAARYPHTFYGILATRAAGNKIALPVAAVTKAGTAKAAAYPVPNWRPHDEYSIEPALLFAIIRKESGFNPNAKSHRGARGLMQIMPGTARHIAERIGAPKPDNARLMNRNVNIALGQAYLNDLLKSKPVDGNLIYLLAAYNAGPGNLQKWLKNTRNTHDPLLFIESIPVAETRNYTKQVMANYWIYQEILGQRTSSAQALLSGLWPSYGGADMPLASAI